MLKYDNYITFYQFLFNFKMKIKLLFYVIFNKKIMILLDCLKINIKNIKINMMNMMNLNVF